MKNILSGFCSFILVALISTSSFANEVDTKTAKLGENDIIANVILQTTNSEKLKTTAAGYGYNIDNYKKSNFVEIANEKSKDYFQIITGVLIIVLLACSVLIVYKYATGNKDKKSGSVVVQAALNTAIGFSAIGGLTSLLSIGILTLALYIAATGNGLFTNIVNAYADSVVKQDVKHLYTLREGDSEFKNYLDIAISEKRTLQARIVKLSDTPDVGKLDVEDFTKYIQEIEKFTADAEETQYYFDKINSTFVLTAPTVKQAWYSFGKDKNNYPAIAASFGFIYGAGDISGEYNANDDSRRDLIVKLLSQDTTDTYKIYEELKIKIAAELDNGTSNYLKADYTNYIDAISSNQTALMTSLSSEASDKSEFVDNATFLYTFVGAKYKGIDDKYTALKFYKDLSSKSLNVLNLHCSQIPAERKTSVSNFNKLINSSSNIQTAFIESKVDKECVIIQDGKFVLLGFNDETDTALMKQAMIEVKTKVEAGNILYKIIDAATEISKTKFIAKNADYKAGLNQSMELGIANIMSTIGKLAEIEYANFKISANQNSKLKFQNNINNLYIVEDAVFGLTEDDRLSMSENDKKAISGKFKVMNLKYLYDSGIVLDNVSNNSRMLVEQSSVGDEDSYTEMFMSVLALGGDSVFKYALGIPQNMSVMRGLEFCDKNSCDSVYKPSLYEIQTYGGKEVAKTAFQCLIGINVVKAANSLLDVSAQATIGSKLVSAAKFAGKTLKVVLASADAAAKTYEPICYAMLTVGIMSGYIAPAFQATIGIFIIISILITLIFLPIAAPLIACLSTVNLLMTGDNGVMHKYLKMIFGNLLLLFIFVPAAMLIISMMLFRPYELLRGIVASGISDGGILSLLISLMVILFVVTILVSLIVSKLSELLQDFSSTLNLGTRIDGSAENKIVQLAGSQFIGNQISGVVKAGPDLLVDLITKNEKEKELSKKHGDQLNTMANDALKSTDINDEGKVKLKELMDKINKGQA